MCSDILRCVFFHQYVRCTIRVSNYDYLLSIVLLVSILVVSDLILFKLLAENSDLRLERNAGKLRLVELRSRRGSSHQEDKSELKKDTLS